MSSIIIDGEPEKEATEKEVACTKEIVAPNELVVETTEDVASANEVVTTKKPAK